MDFFKNLLIALGAAGPFTLFAFAALDSAVLPAAQLVDLMVFAEALAAPESAWLLASWATVGSTMGAMALYFAARQGGRLTLKRVSPERLRSLREKVERYDALALAVPAISPAPLPLKAGIIAAGLVKLSPWRVAAAIGIARCIRYLGIVWLARTFGAEAFEGLEQYVWVVMAACVAGAGLLAWARHALAERASEV